MEDAWASEMEESLPSTNISLETVYPETGEKTQPILKLTV